MLQKLIYNFIIGLEALRQNRMRALLTSLGIIFGVSSVIAMLAIGQGAQQEILQQMELLGANNIIITPIIEQEEGEVEEEILLMANKPKRFTPGLSMLDVEGLKELPGIEAAMPEVVMETLVIREARKRSTKLIGVNQNYFKYQNLSLLQGNFFNRVQFDESRPVCIIGYDVKTKFFPTDEPIGKKIKCGRLWLTVIGVLDRRNISEEAREELAQVGIRNFDLDIYIPINTLLLRYKNRALITQRDIEVAAKEEDEEQNEVSTEPVNYHQIDRLVLRVNDTRYMKKLAEISNRMLTRRHNQVVDFEITIPDVLLEQKRRTTTIFNFVLGAIASISLIVGGIGIMNIMLASVMERIKEIGLRLSVGATKKDIVLQFMSEAVAISVSGGIIGILLGVSLSYIIKYFSGISTIVSTWSILLSFVVAVSIGLVFGIYPARQAARQDPVVSLRSN